MLVLAPLDLNQNELRNPVAQNLASAPSSPVAGQFYFDTSTSPGILYWYDGTSWIPASGGSPTGSAGGDLTGTYPNPSIAAGAVTNSKVSGSAAIAYSKLNLASSIVNADVSSSAAIAYSKLNLSSSIVNADVAAGAAIALSKLATDPLARANHTGTQTASTISDFDTQVRTSRLDQMAAPNTDLSMASHKITSLSDPTSAQDAATKAYVDAAAVGIDWKASVRVATTGAGTLASSFENGDTVDGVVLATGDRILIKDQASGAENGIYVVAASGAPARASDADTAAELTAGMAVFVEEGTTNADSGWLLTNDGAITVGTTALTFTQFTGLGQVTAGAALTKTGNTLDVAVDTTTVEVSSDALRIAAGAAGAGLTGGGGSALAVGAGTGITVNANDVAVDTSTVARYVTGLMGNGSATSIAVTHGLGNRYVTAQVFDATTLALVMVDTVLTSTTQTTFTFTTAPASNAYRYVIVG